MSELYNLAWNLGTLVLFWCVFVFGVTVKATTYGWMDVGRFGGAVIFLRLEGWTYGDEVYL